MSISKMSQAIAELQRMVNSGEVLKSLVTLTNGDIEKVKPLELNFGDWVIVEDSMLRESVLLKVDDCVVGNVGAVIEYVTGEQVGVSSDFELQVVRAGKLEKAAGVAE